METDTQQSSSATQILLRNATNTTARISYNNAVEQNGGANLLFPIKRSKRASIGIEIMGSKTLIRDKVSFWIRCSFLSNFQYQKNLDEFLKELAKYVSVPNFQMKLPKKYTNYRDMYTEGNSFYYLLPSTTRNILLHESVDFENITFKITPYAQERLSALGIDVIKEVKDILALQRNPTQQELANAVEFLDLCDELHLTNASYKAKSMFAISLEEYNAKIKSIKERFELITKEMPYMIMPDLYNYKVVRTLAPFDEWKMDNEEDLGENWANIDDEDKEQYEDFDDYCEKIYAEQDDRVELQRYNLNNEMEAEEETGFEGEEEIEEDEEE